MNLQFENVQVQDIMTPNPLRLDEDMPLEEIFALFTAHRLYCAPVVDQENRFQGCISIGDLERSRQLYDLKEYLGIIVSGLDEETRRRIAESFSWDGPINLRAREVMSAKSPRVLPTESVQEVSQRLLENSTHYAMVVDNESHVVGTVTTFDILKLLQTARMG